MKSVASPVPKRSTVLAVGVALSFFLASCGSSSSKSSSNSTSAAAQSTDSGSSGNEIVVGLANNEGQSISIPQYRYGAEAAVDYINATGGINGTKVKLNECINDGSPAGSVNCANKFAAAHAVTYFAGTDNGADAALPILKAAGIPFVSSTPWGPLQQTSPQAFIFGPGHTNVAIGELAAVKMAGIKKLGYIYYNLPALTSSLPLIDAAAKSLGISTVHLEASLTSPDWSAIIATAQSSGVDGLLGNFIEPHCTALVKTARASGFDDPLVLGTCSEYIKADGDAAKNTYTISPTYLPAVAKDASAAFQKNLGIYTKYMKAAGHGSDLNSSATSSFSAMVELGEVMKAQTGKITGKSMLAALPTAKVPGFLGDDVNCATTAFKADRTSCVTGLLVLKVVSGSNGVSQTVASDGFVDTGAFK